LLGLPITSRVIVNRRDHHAERGAPQQGVELPSKLLKG
jgi:hypothetical protein